MGDVVARPVAPESEPTLVLTAMLAEYESLRAESLASIGHRISIMNFTFGAIAVLLAALIASPLPATFGAAVSLAVLPQIAKAALLIWLGEYARSQRAGRGIAHLEVQLNAFLRATVLTWETSLQTRSTHMGYPYVATVFLLMGTAYAAEIVGLWFVVDALRNWSGPWLLVVVGLGFALLLLEAAFLRFFRARWASARRG